MIRSRRVSKINTFSFGFDGGYGTQLPMKVADQHNEIELNFIGHGEVTFQHGAQELKIGARQMVIFWAAIPHQVVRVLPRTQLAWLALPLRWFLSWNLSSSLTKWVLDGHVLRVSNPPVSQIIQWADDLGKKSAELEKIVELELEVYFRRLALTYRRQKSQHLHRDSLPVLQKNQYGHVQKMVRFMTTHFQRPITVPEISASAGLNAEYAMRLFRKCWGMTLWGFLLQQRVFHAQRLLVLGETKILDLAFACGFGSTSRFYEAFKAHCHCTPSEFRVRNRSEVRSKDIKTKPQ